jgi:hypothetical protein
VGAEISTYQIQLINEEENQSLENLGVYGNTVLKWILK